MAILKLNDPGEEVTLDLVSAEVVQGEFGEQAKFDSNTGDTLYVPLASVERQLDRCGVATVEELTGKTVHFSRSKQLGKNGKPFWNLDKAREGDVVQKPNGKAPEAEAPKPGVDEKRAELRKLHAACFRLVCESYVKLAAEHGVDLSLEGVSALTFQLYKCQVDVK